MAIPASRPLPAWKSRCLKWWSKGCKPTFRCIASLCKMHVLLKAAPAFTTWSTSCRSAPKEEHYARTRAELSGGAGRGFVRSLRSEEHTSELQSLMSISYAVLCLKKKQQKCDYTIQLNKENT